MYKDDAIALLQSWIDKLKKSQTQMVGMSIDDNCGGCYIANLSEFRFNTMNVDGKEVL